MVGKAYPGASPSCNPASRPVCPRHAQEEHTWRESWRALETLYRDGLVHSIGAHGPWAALRVHVGRERLSCFSPHRHYHTKMGIALRTTCMSVDCVGTAPPELLFLRRLPLYICTCKLMS